MNETPENPTPPPEEPAGGEAPREAAAPRRLLRSRSDRVIGGVCGGVARHYGIDPTLVRVGFVAGVVLWGVTAVFYIAAMFLMPEENPDGSAPPPSQGTPLTGRNRTLAAIGVVVLVLVGGPIVLGLGFAAGGILLPFALLILAGLGVAWLVTGRRPEGGDGAQIARLTLLGLGILALLFVLSVGSFWAAAAGGEAIVAGAVVLAGIALIISAFARPARWLILPALAVALPASFVAAAGVDLDGGVGEKLYHPDGYSEIRPDYQLGAGHLTIDLRDVVLPDGERHMHVDLGMGEAEVLVPMGVCVSTTAELGMGGAQVFDRDGGGIDVEFEDRRSPPPGTPTLVIDADVGLGALEVRHDDRGEHFGGFEDGPANEACRRA